MFYIKLTKGGKLIFGFADSIFRGRILVYSNTARTNFRSVIKNASRFMLFPPNKCVTSSFSFLITIVSLRSHFFSLLFISAMNCNLFFLRGNEL